ncbi:right-handed parallel beta-helix repeat-containing protein [Parasediminibacterium sp. JCM 36343]|uniref:right-handed parallel beta-helix repeat-containing protein n=1 Tax=Parasediminibacterium sp. JCM 36343 TaxID=3374279 RepID=UPI00397D41F7
MNKFISAFILCIAMYASPAQTLKQIYISTTGKDVWDGSFQKPFYSIEAGQRLVNNCIATCKYDSIKIIFRAGTYQLTNTLLINNNSNCKKPVPLLYTNYNNEKVIISGGRQLESKWIKDNSNSQDNGVWKLVLPDSLANTWILNSLYCNNKLLMPAISDTLFTVGPLSQFAHSSGVYDFAGIKRLMKDSIAAFSGFIFEDTDVNKMQGLINAKLIMYNSWETSWHSMFDADIKNRVMNLASPGLYPIGFFAKKNRYQIVNARQFFTKKNQWYFDSNQKTLYYRGDATTNPNSMKFIVPFLKTIVFINGSELNHAKNVSFRNIKFSHAASIWGVHEAEPVSKYVYVADLKKIHSSEGFSTAQASISCGQSVMVQNADSCTFDNCKFTASENYGIHIGENTSHNIISNCGFVGLGGGGVIVGFDNLANQIKFTNNSKDTAIKMGYGTRFTLKNCPSYNIVTNCIIFNCGLVHLGTPGICLMHSNNTLITQNYIANLPYSGISSGWWLNPDKNSDANNVISYNNISNVMCKLADGGGIYTLNSQPSTVYKDNYIHDISRSKTATGSRNNGFFFDVNSAGFSVENNVVTGILNEDYRFNATDSTKIIFNHNFFEKQRPTDNNSGLLDNIKSSLPYFNFTKESVEKMVSVY